jgi:hypothetical protein
VQVSNYDNKDTYPHMMSQVQREMRIEAKARVEGLDKLGRNLREDIGKTHAADMAQEEAARFQKSHRNPTPHPILIAMWISGVVGGGVINRKNK